MQGDSIVVEEHHKKAASGVAEILMQQIDLFDSRTTISIAGESGSGKSETAQALADELEKNGFSCYIFQQDDYFIHPPKTNDKTRRENIDWVGSGEVRLDLLDQHLEQFLSGENTLKKPLVFYEEDRVDEEEIDLSSVNVVIAEGTYTTLLDQARNHVFIDRSYLETRAHREKRKRDESELDDFIENVLSIEHEIISSHKKRASIIIDADYNASASNTNNINE